MLPGVTVVPTPIPAPPERLCAGQYKNIYMIHICLASVDILILRVRVTVWHSTVAGGLEI